MNGIDRSPVSEHEEIIEAAKEENAPKMQQFLNFHLDKARDGTGVLLEQNPNYFADPKHGQENNITSDKFPSSEPNKRKKP